MGARHLIGLRTMVALIVVGAVTLSGVTAVATGAAATGAKPIAWVPETEDFLVIQVSGDSVDFRLADPQGRIAVVAVDSAMSGIPDCDVSKSSDEPSNDEDRFDADTSSGPPPRYGGGAFMLQNPPPGEWRLEAFARRSCRDPCTASVLAWSTKNASLDGACTLRSGQLARWSLLLDTLDVRKHQSWAHLKLQFRGKIKRPRVVGGP